MQKSPNHAAHPWLVSLMCCLTLLFGSVMLLRAQTRPVEAATPVVRAAKARNAGAIPEKLRFKFTPSPNCRRMASRHVDTVVVHYLSGINVDADRWDDPQLALQILRDNHVSAHYMIDRLGTAYQLVDESDVAWHAGGSIMPAPDNRRNVNTFSIGIEMIATKGSGFTDEQYGALTRLITEIKGRHAIRHLVGHDQISGKRAVGLGLRRDVKPDPGPHFDWGRLKSMLQSAA